MGTRPQVQDVADLVSYWLAVFPPRAEHAPDQASLLRAYWKAVETRPWITVELLMKVADNVLTHEKFFPSPADFLDYCLALKPKTENGGQYVDATRLLADIRAAEQAPSSLTRAIASGQWDRGTARGRLITQGVKNPTTAQLDAELQTETFPHRGPVGAALRARLTLTHVIEEDCR